MRSNNANSYHLLDPAFIAERYTLYHVMREADPVHWSEEVQAWVLTRHEHVAAELRDPRLSVQRGNTYMGMLTEQEQQELSPLREFYAQWLMFIDPPEHTQLRALINPSFTLKAVGRMAGTIQSDTDALFDRVASSQTIDILHDVAHPLAISVIMRLLGLDPVDSDQLVAWSDNIIQFLGTGQPNMERGRQALRSLEGFMDFFSPIIDRRRGRPADDLISEMIIRGSAAHGVSDEEVAAMCANVLIDGHDPVRNAIGNGLLALVRHPEIMTALRDAPYQIERAVEEMLRYDCPFQYAGRRVRHSFSIGDVTLKEGQRVMLMLASANRDHRQFTAPDDFIVTRRSHQHLAFGLGSHYCLGASLARMTIQTFFRTLLSRYPIVRILDAPLMWRHSLGYRSLAGLPMTTTNNQQGNDDHPEHKGSA